MKNNILLKLFTVLFAVITFQNANGQGECLQIGFCAVSSEQYPPFDQSTTSPTFVSIATDMYAGEYALCNVVTGTTYEWSLCPLDGGSASYDTQLTLFNASNNAPLCHSDDFCNLDAKISWTATFTGQVKVQVNQYNCNANTTNTTLRWRGVSSTPNDAAVSNVYTMGKIAIPYINPHVVTARITNAGSTALTNLSVTLNVSGANTFTNTQTIANLAVGTSTIVTFTGYTSANAGTNTVQVSVPADGNNANNSISVSQQVTNDSYSYAYGTTAADGVGFNAATGEIAVKFTTNTPTSISQVKNHFETAGSQYQVRIWDASGAGSTPGSVLYTSPTQTSTLGVNTVNLSPAVNVTGTFYVGVVQTGTTNIGIGYQDESPIRAQTFYGTSPIGGAWFDFSIEGLIFRIMIEPVFTATQTITDAAVTNVYTMGTIANPFINPHVVTARISNTGTTTLTNLPVTLNVSGANTFTNIQTISSLAPGSSSIVTFTGYNSTNTGTNTVQVSVPADGNNANNSISVTQTVNNNSYNYAYGSSTNGGAGFNGVDGEVAVKFNTSSSTTIVEVKTTFESAGNAYQLRIWDATGASGTPGAILYTSISQTSVMGTSTVTVNPPVNVNGTFYVGLVQTGTTNFGMLFQDEVPLRTQTFYTSAPIGNPWVDLAGVADFRLFLEPVFQACATPNQPGSISGNTTLCEGNSETYSVSTVPNATSYTWTLPTGWSGTSTTNSITVTAGANSGNISVTANNTCGSSSSQTLAVTTNPLPTQPGTITGVTSICVGGSETYSVQSVSGATSYTWSLPSGWTGTSTTNSINVTAGSNSGNITVTANNTCGSSVAQVLQVNTNTLPAQPGAISGDVTVCDGASKTYSIASVPGATLYTWTLPSGWTGTSTTNSISVTVGQNSGDIAVAANSSCGSSASQILSVTVNALPVQPGIITGDVIVCSGSSKTYSISSVQGATSYVWTLPSGWPGSSTSTSITTIAGSTGGTVSVAAINNCGTGSAQTLSVTSTTTPATPSTITGSIAACSGISEVYSVTSAPGTDYNWTLPSGWSGSSSTNSITTTAGTTGGAVSVTASNSCGTSSAQSLSVSVSTNAPAQPGQISGKTVVCGSASETYSVSAVTGATSYVWTLPSGWTGTSSTNSISANTGTSGGTITVAAVNGCGTSTSQTLAVTVDAIPAQPGSITGSSTVCDGTSQTYSVSSVSGATSYTWTLPSGWSGSSSSNSITVNAGTSGGTISVAANIGDCSGPAQTMNVTVNTVPAQPGSINGATSVCSGSSETYFINSVPGATSYTWVLPSGWSGTSTSDFISASVGNSSGVIIVNASNSCGTGSSQQLSVNVTSTPEVSLSSFGTVCSNQQAFSLTGGSPSGGSYSGNGVSGGMFNPSVAGIGTHTITYTLALGNCSGSTSQTIQVEECTQIEEVSIENSLTISPNPANERINIQFDNVYDSAVTLNMFTVDGKLVHSEVVNSYENYYKTLDVSGFSKGVYSLRITSVNEIVNKKVVVY